MIVVHLGKSDWLAPIKSTVESVQAVLISGSTSRAFSRK
jgi:hypothetical protein